MALGVVVIYGLVTCVPDRAGLQTPNCLPNTAMLVTPLLQRDCEPAELSTAATRGLAMLGIKRGKGVLLSPPAVLGTPAHTCLQRLLAASGQRPQAGRGRSGTGSPWTAWHHIRTWMFPYFS